VVDRSERVELPAGLVMDWGGVLTPSLDAAMRAWTERDGIDHEHFRAVMQSWVGRRDPDASGSGGAAAVDDPPVADLEQAEDAGPAGSSPVHRLERGELPPSDFEVELAGELARRGSPVAATGLLDRMLGGLGPLDDDMIGLVRRAHRSGLRTALLSNSWGNHYPDALWDDLFDAVVISGEVGMRKPDRRIFLHTADLLGLPPSRCVMVDDLPHNIAGAVKAGMVAVQHRTYAETLAELEVLFDRDLSP
jgi:putative hydrolase of the HAD superfamily